MTTALVTDARRVHIVYNGQSHDVPFTDLDIGDTSTDDQVKNACASHFSIPDSKLRFYQVDREQTGNITVRPQAVFG